MEQLESSAPSGTFWVMDLRDPPIPAVETVGAVAFSRAVPEQAEEIVGMTGEVEAAEVRRRLAGGRQCYLGRMDGTLAVYGWVSFDEEEIGEQGLHLRLLPGEAYVWNCVTAPAHRRRGLYAALLQHIVSELRAEGVSRVWIGADSANIPSQRGMARAGFTPVLDLYVAMENGRRNFRVTGYPNVPAALVAEARRVLLGR